MKKRLLSAALALAMVLTLLPVSAFAVDPESTTPKPDASDTTTPAAPEAPVKAPAQQPANAAAPAAGARTAGTAPDPYVEATAPNQNVTYHEKDYKLGNNFVADQNGWYYSTSDSTGTAWHRVTGGVAAGTTSGKWYASVGDALTAKAGTITLIGGAVLSGNLWVTSGCSIDLDGHSITGGGTLIVGANNITLELKNSETVGTATVNLQVGNDVVGQSYNGNVTLTNVALTGTINSYFSSSSTVKVDNSVLTGTITLTGTPTTAGAATSGGRVEVTGSKASVAGLITVGHTNGTGGAVSVSNGGKATGGITVNQDSGNNTVTVTGSGSNGGDITVTQETGGSISVTSSATAGTLELTSTKNPSISVNSSAFVAEIIGRGDGLVVDISNYGRVNGDVQLSGRMGGVTPEEATSLAAPKVVVNGGIVGADIKNSNQTEVLQKDYTVEVKGGGTVTGKINLYRSVITVTGATVTGGILLNSGLLTAGPNANVTGDILLGSASTVTQAGPTATMNVSGFGNTIGSIKDATTNDKTLVLTIPGITDFTKQNPKDNDSNKFNGVWINDFAKVDQDKSYIAGGHYKFNCPQVIELLTPGLTYVVQEKVNTNGFDSFVYSYWGNSVNHINVLAGMTSLADDNGWPVISTKDAPDDGSVKTVTLYAYTPRTQPDGKPTASVGTETNAAKAVLRIKFKQPAAGSINTFILPSILGTNKSINWSECTATNNNGVATIVVDSAARKVVGGESIAPTDSITYVSNSLNYQVTKVLDVQTAAVGQYNATVKAKLEGGNTIVLSGLAKVYGTGNSAVIPLEVETDAIEKVYVDAVWNPADKTLFFTDPAGHPKLSAQTGGGLIIANDSGSHLLLVSSNTKIGLKAGSLTEDTLKNVTFQGNTSASLGGMVTTTNRLPDNQGYGSDFKKALAEAMTKPAGAAGVGVVDFSLSPTVQQEFGAYIAKLNQNTLDGYLKKVQQDKYQEQYKKANNKTLTSAQLNALTPTQLAGTGYNTIAVVLYMNVDVTSFGNNIPYTMTATMTPYARVEIQHGTYNAADWKNNPPVVVVNGTSLGTLDSGNVGKVEVTIPDITSVFPGQSAAAGYVHQNSTYVATVAAQKFTLTHTAANGAGFGTIVLNNVEPLAEIYTTANAAYSPVAKLYDTVQSAVDEAKNGETVKVNGAVGSTVEYPINVTGRARTIYIDVTGNRKITKANNASDVIITQPTGNSTVYTVQLTKDNNVVKPTEKPIPISVTSATGGAASVSASRADEGDTITVTLTPATNYRVGGVTVTAAVKNSSTGVTTNTTVATTAASANSWRFVVPTGATSVTVTPSFVATSTGATVTVSSATGGTATTSAGTNRVAPGSTVSVTTVPSSGYRTMGLVVTSNTGSATATRTGVNSYVFTVPAGSTNVVVTPRFDVNNGTVFEDVWSTEYFSSAVAWAVGRGVTNGTDTYHFSPYNNCTRADMVTFLYRAAGSPAVGNVANPFWDVQPGSYYYNAVLWAVSKGITNGVSANQFGVNQIVTRAQAVTFLHRYNGSPAPASGNRFYDVPAREYYANAVAWATGKGVTNGTSTTLFSPNQAVTRAQAVAFLYRDFNNVRA